MVTIVSSKTRLSAETIGQGMKSLFSRMQNVKVGKFVDAETGESLNDVEKVLNSLGIRLRISETEWRDVGEVMEEVGAKFKDFNQIQQSAIATAMGGKVSATTYGNIWVCIYIPEHVYIS